MTIFEIKMMMFVLAVSFGAQANYLLYVAIDYPPKKRLVHIVIMFVMMLASMWWLAIGGVN